MKPETLKRGRFPRQRIFSGIQPTGKLHIGNYIGALKAWSGLQRDFECIFCIADLHALTNVGQTDIGAVENKTLEVAALLIACGIDPKSSALFVQSSIPAHCEMTWILNCITPIGWLERMTQFKSKTAREKSKKTAGLLDYPVLQAADILLYETDFVPVGEDQKQHLELTKKIANRFNRIFGGRLRVPEPILTEKGSRIMGLDDPTVKMSKSIGVKTEKHMVGLMDLPGHIHKVVMNAKTDSGRTVRTASASPGVKNLLAIYESLSGDSGKKIEAQFEGKGYDFLKKETAELIISILNPIQKRFKDLILEPRYLKSVLRKGGEKAYAISNRTLSKVKRNVGIGSYST